MNKKWRWFLPGYVWSLPLTLVGLAWFTLRWGGRNYRWSDGCLECTSERMTKSPWGAQTMGWVICYRDVDTRQWSTTEQGEQLPSLQSLRDLSDLRVHERTHVVQGFIAGPLLPVAYAAAFLWNYVRTRDFMDSYAANPLELQADSVEQNPNGWGVTQYHRWRKPVS